MKKLSKYLIQQGYEINREFSGNNNKMYVLRFRGNFLESFKTFEHAYFAAIFHNDTHTNNLL